MSSGTRKRIDPTDEATLLISCRRRCCLCALYKSDFSRKKGQIAHIDGDRTNAAIANLAFLCFECHDEFDSRSSQSKNFTPKELRLCKQRLESYYAGDKQLRVTISVTLDLTPAEFDQRRDDIHDLLSSAIGREINAINLRFGTDTADLDLSTDETHRLVLETAGGTLGAIKLRDREIIDVRCISSRITPAFSDGFGDDYLDEFVSKEAITKTFESPKSEVHFDATGNSCQFDESVLSIFVKQFGSSTRQFAVVVFVVRSEKSPTERIFHPAIRVYRSEFSYSDSWNAVDYASAFAERYGITIQPFSRRMILPPDKISGLETITRTVASTSFRGPYHYIAMQQTSFLGVTNIYFMLIVNVVAYAKSLRSHGYRLPPTFRKKLRTKDRFPLDL